MEISAGDPANSALLEYLHARATVLGGDMWSSRSSRGAGRVRSDFAGTAALLLGAFALDGVGAFLEVQEVLLELWGFRLGTARSAVTLRAAMVMVSWCHGGGLDGGMRI